MTQIHRELGKRREKPQNSAEVHELGDAVAQRNVLGPQEEAKKRVVE